MYAFRVSNALAKDQLLAWLASGLDRKRGKTQAGLAEFLGVTQPRISEILAGKRRIQAAEIPKIAQYIERPPPLGWLPMELPPSDDVDPTRKSKIEIRFGLHENPDLVWIFIFDDDRLIAQFEADFADLDTCRRRLTRAIESLSRQK
jgi:transcriptional regulator with XRE-family HTH domain